jgi:hypothetical protein
MAPLVEMLPTNFPLVEASPLDPESGLEPELEVEPDPELEPAPELDDDEGPDPWLEPELELAVASSEPELGAAPLDALLARPESAEGPAAPLDGFSPDDPQATATHKAAIGTRGRKQATRFIYPLVAEERATGP